jgi:hypothetical protein
MTPEEGYRLGIINKSTLWYQKKNLIRGKNQIYINILQNQGDQIRTSNVH